MRALFPFALLLLLSPLADAKPKELTARRFAKGVEMAVRKAEAATFQALCHEDYWGAPKDNGKLLFGQLTSAGISVEFERKEQRVVGERSLLPLKLSKGGQVLGSYVLRIDYRRDRWGISAADEAKPEHEAWLAAGLKEGQASTPAEAVRSLLEGIASENKPQARLHVTEAGWHPPGDYLFSLYRQAVKKGLVLTLEGEVRVEGSRAVAVVDVARKGRSVDKVMLYLVKRKGWLVAALDEDEEHARSYLEGKSAAKRRATRPRSLAYDFDDWKQSRQEFRALWSEAGWKGSGEALYERLNAKKDPEVYTSPRDSETEAAPRVVIVFQTFAVDDSDDFPGGAEDAPRKKPEPLEELFLLAQDSPAGWRFVGVAKDEAAAKAWQEGK